MRVLHVSEVIKGGVGTYLNTLILEQIKDPLVEDVQVIACRQHRKSLPDIPDKHVIEYDYPRRSVTGILRLQSIIAETVQSYRPTIVHLASSFPGLVGRINIWNRRWMTTIDKPAVVYCSHGWSFLMDVGNTKAFLYRIVEKQLAAHCDRIICISKHEYEAAIAVGIPARKCDLIYNGLCPETPALGALVIPDAVDCARRRGDLVFLFVGRYDYQKGLDLLTPIFDGAPDFGPVLITAGGNIVGSSNKPFASRVHDIGWVTQEQISTLLIHADAVIMPSRWEGFGLVAIEAMRAGRAVICSSRGGLPEVVEDGVTGVVLKSLSTEEIRQVVTNTSRTQLLAYGMAGRERFLSHFTSQRMHQETMRSYGHAISYRTGRVVPD